MSVPAVPVIEAPDLSGLMRVSDLDLMHGMSRWAEHVRLAESVVAAFAGEVDRRSARDRGYGGLAQATGDRTPEHLVARLTGRSIRDARDLVTVGKMVGAPPVWLSEVADGVVSGQVSIEAAAAITAALGTPSDSVAPDDLLDAAQILVAEASTLPPERVARHARELRDELDAVGVAERENLMREKRFLRLTPQADGMTRLFGLLDAESAALVTDAIDCVTAPRRGGPQFVDETELARVEALKNDPRTTEQIAVDALVDMVRIAGDADQGRVFGVRKPAVRVHVSADDLSRRIGAGHLEGQTASVSIATVERLICADGCQPVVFESGGVLDVGRAQRLFTERQRVALAAVWGGCAFPDCDRPPSWTEAHHARPWNRDGRTDVSNGILLCRFHHMLVHNNGWRIEPPRPGRGNPAGQGWLAQPPPGDPLHRGPIELQSKSLIRRRG